MAAHPRISSPLLVEVIAGFKLGTAGLQSGVATNDPPLLPTNEPPLLPTLFPTNEPPLLIRIID